MASLSPEQEASFSAVIDGILKNSDLTSVSAKQVRKKLAERVGQDLSEYKEAINALIGSRFDAVSAAVIEPTVEEPHTNGVVKSIEQPATPVSPPRGNSAKRSAPSEESELSDVIDSPKPKKKRKATTVEDDDAAFAARLQEEENRNARPTRGGASRKRAPVKSAPKKKKKKSAAKVKDDDDTSKESGSDEPKERKGGFHKPMNLSQPLAELLGETQLSRPQTVKKIWEYVRARDLQDPADKRQIRCDEPLRKVFKSDRVHMFTMNKILAQNLYAVDE
ncbi:Upstream activation factor subunit spp27 [Sphaceloma murrayae]|uniref:Upstream activation factor subunit spp27 n=1 Tax=Sphaceloma murrayae TaxID=2082308 RepID=A0A2K1QRL6_9PEZI|nr:Upstream activation factor subunit spp27 [Sphaceloma murrayae]